MGAKYETNEKYESIIKTNVSSALSTVAASSVIACSDNSEGILLNKKVSQHLQLTNAEGKGLLAPTISIDENNKSQVSLKIDTSTMKVVQLVDNQKKPKIKKVLHF